MSSGVHIGILIGDAAHGMRWSSNGSVCGPASLNAHSSAGIAHNLQFFAPLLNWFRNSINCGQQCVAPVIDLFKFGRPSAVSGLIIAAIVVALNRVRRSWLFSHISKEILERFQPARADRNPSAAVIVVAGVSGVEASILHVLPRKILGTSGLAMLGMDFCRKAAARLGAQFLQVIASASGLFAAITLAKPERFARRYWGAPNNNQSAVAIAGNIYNCAFPHDYFLGVTNG